jgi:integrase
MIRRKGIPTVTRTFPTKREADAFAADMESRIAKGKSVASPDAYTVGQAIEEYAASIAVPIVIDGETTMKVDGRKAAYLNGLLPPFGEFSVGFLRAKHIKKFVDLMKTTPIPRPAHAKKAHPLYAGSKEKFYAESTIRKFVYALKSTLDYHARQHGYTYDPHLFSEEKPAAWDNVRERRLKDGEQEKVLDACRHIITRNNGGDIIKKRDRKHGDLYAALVVFLLETGSRLQEALLAEWQEFDTENRTWTIPKAHVKTKQGREVPLSKISLSVLNNLSETTGMKARPFGQIPKGKAIFVTWKRICKDAQIDDLGFHDLRHECICHWVLRGGSDLQISKAAGHDISVMQKYASLRGSELLTFVDA